MRSSFLEKILETKRSRVEALKRTADAARLRENALHKRQTAEQHRLRNALEVNERINIIAEIKRASPSKGVINDNIDIAETALSYEAGGACAISVLTEEDFFEGSLDDLKNVRQVASLPILRKDFIVDDFQIYEAAEAGADAVLLIVAALADETLGQFYQLAHAELGLDVVVEVHTVEELKRAVAIEAEIIGVNNRDLRSFAVSLDVSRELIKYKPAGVLMISESGITSASELPELQRLGFEGFLLGESLMRSPNPEKELRKMTVNY